MYYSFAVNLDETIQIETSQENSDARVPSEHKFIWVDLENPTEDELHSVAKQFNLHDDAVDDSLHGEQRPRIDEFDEHAFIMLYGALGPESDAEFSPRKLAIFVTSDHIITVHAEPLVTIEGLQKRLNKKSRQANMIQTDYVLHSIVDAMVDNYLLVTEEYDKRLDELEVISLAEEPEPDLLPKVLGLRRDMLELRRLAASLREVLHPLVAGELDFVSDKIAVDFIHVRDHLTMAIETIDNLRELLNGVRDNYHAALALRANRIMQTLTIFASLFLPLSLVAGIYGMNMPLWPSVESSVSFWIIMGFMVVNIGVMLALYKRNNWF